MGTLLKVLTVLILLLSIFAFVMGLSLFDKREELLGRTQALEEKIRQIAGTIETSPPAATDENFFSTGYDVSRVDDRVNDDPELNNFWDSYKAGLENRSPDQFNLNTEANRAKLRTYWRMVPHETEPGRMVVYKDPTTREKSNTGKDTMDELLRDVLDKAQKQLARLNDTRAQLINVRQEFETVIGLFNEEKKAHRRSKVEITRLNGVITRLEGTVAALEQDKARLERQVRELQDTVADKEATIKKHVDTIQDLDIQVKKQAEEITRLRDIINLKTGVNRSGVTISDLKLSPGEKGRIISIEKDLAFVVIQLNDTARSELIADGTFAAGTELMVYRKEGGKDIIVSRIRLTNPPNSSNLSIAEIVYGWTQVPIKEGDLIIHQ